MYSRYDTNHNISSIGDIGLSHKLLLLIRFSGKQVGWDILLTLSKNDTPVFNQRDQMIEIWVASVRVWILIHLYFSTEDYIEDVLSGKPHLDRHGYL